mmetsp:Transcript_3521/g.6151  ORF Transcript_3521/g.6151 Transcript_3521/m.6151 type:complete len:205 (-) Transcript_3521:724-1338(-)
MDMGMAMTAQQRIEINNGYRNSGCSNNDRSCVDDDGSALDSFFALPPKFVDESFVNVDACISSSCSLSRRSSIVAGGGELNLTKLTSTASTTLKQKLTTYRPTYVHFPCPNRVTAAISGPTNAAKQPPHKVNVIAREANGEDTASAAANLKPIPIPVPNPKITFDTRTRISDSRCNPRHATPAPQQPMIAPNHRPTFLPYRFSL